MAPVYAVKKETPEQAKEIALANLREDIGNYGTMEDLKARVEFRLSTAKQYSSNPNSIVSGERIRYYESALKALDWIERKNYMRDGESGEIGKKRAIALKADPAAAVIYDWALMQIEKRNIPQEKKKNSGDLGENGFALLGKPIRRFGNDAPRRA
jgi:hypothetical protein